MVQEVLVGEMENEARKGRKPRTGCTSEQVASDLLGLFATWTHGHMDTCRAVSPSEQGSGFISFCMLSAAPGMSALL